MGPNVQIMDVERKIVSPLAHQVSIRVTKALYQKFVSALNAYAGSWIKNETDRVNLGLPRKNDFNDPGLKLIKREYDNFSQRMDIEMASVANFCVKGDSTSALFRIIRQLPSVYTLTKTKHF